MARFELSEIQANAILEMQLRRLAALERKKIEDEYLAMIKLIAELEDILANPARVLAIIKDETRPRWPRSTPGARLHARRRRRGPRAVRRGPHRRRGRRRSRSPVAATSSASRSATYRRQARGGKGIIGARTVEEDAVAHLLVANTHDWALFFTNRGRVFSSKVHQIPDAAARRRASRSSTSRASRSSPASAILAVITVPNFEKGGNLVMATVKGVIKKTPIEQFERVRSTGIRAITVRPRTTSSPGSRSHPGTTRSSSPRPRARSRGSTRTRSVRWAATPPASSASGSSRPGDRVVVHGRRRPTNSQILVLTETGYGKRARVEEFRSNAPRLRRA